MQKVFLLLFILIFTSGCISEKKEKKTDALTQNTVVSETPIPKLEVKDTSINSKEIKNQEIKDSIVGINEVNEVQEVIKVTENSDEIITPIKDPVKENIEAKEIEKIRPDHSDWNLLSKKYVSASGKVNYVGFKTNITKIKAYLLHLQNTAPKKDWNKNEKLAYWFNLYNASTIQLVASAYPVKSIKNINNGKPWDKKFIKSGNKVYSLNEIENTIVRPNFNEPRLHVAFNCAAISCPKLLNEAFTPTKLNSQLNKLSKIWINDPTKNKITENSIEISKIFEWYAVDFKKGIIPFINQYAATKVSNSLEVKYLEYDWNLND